MWGCERIGGRRAAHKGFALGDRDTGTGRAVSSILPARICSVAARNKGKKRGGPRGPESRGEPRSSSSAKSSPEARGKFNSTGQLGAEATEGPGPPGAMRAGIGESRERGSESFCAALSVGLRSLHSVPSALASTRCSAQPLVLLSPDASREPQPGRTVGEHLPIAAPCPARPLGPCRLSSGLLHPRAALCPPRAPGSPQCRDKAPREGGRHPHAPRCMGSGYARRHRDVTSACSDIITQPSEGKGRRSRAPSGRAGDGIAVLKSSAGWHWGTGSNPPGREPQMGSMWAPRNPRALPALNQPTWAGGGEKQMRRVEKIMTYLIRRSARRGLPASGFPGSPRPGSALGGPLAPDGSHAGTAVCRSRYHFC